MPRLLAQWVRACHQPGQRAPPCWLPLCGAPIPGEHTAGLLTPRRSWGLDLGQPGPEKRLSRNPEATQGPRAEPRRSSRNPSLAQTESQKQPRLAMVAPRGIAAVPWLYSQARPSQLCSRALALDGVKMRPRAACDWSHGRLSIWSVRSVQVRKPHLLQHSAPWGQRPQCRETHTLSQNRPTLNPSLTPVRVVTAPEQRGSAPSHLMQPLALLLTATPSTKVTLIVWL